MGERRVRHLVLGLLIAHAAAAAVLLPATAAADETVFRLARPLVLHGRRTFTYSLPEAARQGPHSWYVIRLHYRLVFARDSRPGFAWVLTDTNRHTCAQVEYTLTRSGRRLRYRRTTVDLEHGQREKRAAALRDEVRFSNYLQEGGVAGGVNEIAFRLETTRGVGVRQLEILAGTAIVRTRRTPYPFQLRPQLDEEVRVRHGFEITVGLSNAGRRALRDVVVSVRHDPRGLTLLSPRAVRFGALAQRQTAMFRFRARSEGTHRVTFLGDSNRNHPIAVADVRVSGEREGQRPAVLAGLAALLALLVGLAIRRARRTG